MAENARRRRFAPAAIIAGSVGAIALSLSLTGALSGFVATITNSNNTVAAASMAITETGGNPSATCNSFDATSNCSTINKYGGTTTPLVPGGASQTTTVTFKNTGTVPVSSATLVGGTCSASVLSGVSGAVTPSPAPTATNNLCSVMNIVVYAGSNASGTAIYNGSAAGFQGGSNNLNLTLAAGASQAYTFVASLPANATTAVQGQQISQPMTWTFNQ